MKTKYLSFAASLLLLFFPSGVIKGERHSALTPPLDQVMNSLFGVRQFKEVAVSPDGRSVGWVVSLPGKADDAVTLSAIYAIELNPSSSKPHRISAGDGTAALEEHDLVWSPDGRRLAFLSDKAKKGQLQLYVATATEGSARRLTNLKGFLARPQWSPDGKHLAILFTENASRAAGPVQPGTPETGVIEEHVYEQRLAIVDAESGKTRLASPAELYVYEYDWAPDGEKLVLTGAHGSGDNNWYIAQLYTLAVSTGELRSLLKPAMQIAMPRWSPDGKTIAFIGGLMSDEGATGGDIYAIPAGGGRPKNITPRMKASASWLAWQPTSSRILFTEHIDGSVGIGLVDATTGRIETLWRGDENFTARGGALEISVSRDQRTSALVRHSFRQPPEVWAGPLGAWRQVTQTNRDVHPSWGEAKSLHWQSDGYQVQGWLLYPRQFDPKHRYPMVVSVHGGPASARRPGWPGTTFDLSVLASQGYFVLFPNPRGSYGQGEAFTRANVKDFGHGDLRDILAGVDEVLKTAPVDRERLGIAGWSYGGYMTMWAVTQTTRFHSAVAGAGIANWQSYYGQNGIDQWLLPYFGATVYDDPAVYARSSPINYIKRVQTPTLILVGERDLECPVAQSREFWHALKTLGVPTQFVVYPGEGHLIATPGHRRDIIRRTVAWLNKSLQGGDAAEGGDGIFAPDAGLKVEAGGGVGGEGPAWHPNLGVFSSGNGHIYQLNREGRSRIYRKGAGTNGLLFDRKGRLLACDSEGRRITRTELDGKIAILTDRYEGKRYNTPNDLTVDSRGRIYFSDPRYGDRKGMEILDKKGRTVEGVYRVDPDGKVTQIIGRELERPNGLLVSADDRFLYIADNNNDTVGGARKLWRFDLRKDGTVDLASRKLLFDWGAGRGPDGLKQDQKGRLYVAAGLNKPNPPFEPAKDKKGGIYVLSPEGELLTFLPVPRDEVTNCAFGGDDLKTLYITAGGTLYSVRTMTPGKVVWPTAK